MRFPAQSPASKSGRRVALIVLAAHGIAAGATLRAAERFEPPSHWLRKEHRSVVLAEPMPADEAGAQPFRVLEAWSGEAPETITVQMDEAVQESIDASQRYLVGYTSYYEDRRDERFYEYPDGPHLLEIPLVGPALAAPSPHLRRLLEPIDGESGEDARQRLEAIGAQLALPDPIARRWVLADLVLYPQLSDQMTSADLAAFHGAFERAGDDSRSREYVLRILDRQADRLGAEWLVEATRGVVKAHPAELDLRSHVSALLQTALEILADRGSPADAGLARVHVYSNNPTVALAAMRAYIGLDPDRAEAELPALLWEDRLSLDARQVAAEFLRQQQAAESG